MGITPSTTCHAPGAAGRGRMNAPVPADPDRLSALDAAFLDLETDRAPLHVGWTMRFTGAAPSLAALRRHIDGRLAAFPRFRRRVVEPALGLGDPHWADDAGFDVARHVHALRLAAPSGPAELRDLAGVLLASPLEPHRPLWRMTLVTGLQGGGFALVGQAHHALVDGVAALEVAALVLDPLAGGRGQAEAARRWVPGPPPSAAGALGAAVRDRARGGAAAARELAGGAADAARVAGSLVLPTATTALERSSTHERRAAFASAPLSDVRAAAHRHDATVNDALLAASAIALGAALARRGDCPPAVRALVPASTRGGAEAADLGNRIAFLAIDLPLGEPDPVRVLRAVRARTGARKRSGHAGAGDALLRSADLLPPAGRKAAARAAARAARFTLVVSSVTGPAAPLALLGRELTGAWPAVPLLDGHALSIGALSYAGRLHAGVYADADVVPDAAEIARDLERALDALRTAPPQTGTPWRARARARRDAARTA